MARNEITDTLVDKQPIGAIWRTTNKEIADFVDEHLKRKNLEGYIGCAVTMKRSRPVNTLSIMVAFRGNSKELNGGGNQKQGNGNSGFSPLVADKIDDNTGGNRRLSSTLYQSLLPLTGADKVRYKLAKHKSVGQFAAFELDVFSVLAMMYKVDHIREEIIIESVEEVERNGLVTIRFAKECRTTSGREQDLMSSLRAAADGYQ